MEGPALAGLVIREGGASGTGGPALRCAPCGLRLSRPPSAAFRLAQNVVAVRGRRQLSRMDHPMQAHHQRLALDVELCLVEIADDMLYRQADRGLRPDIQD